jgi:hypothetical protein
MPRDAEEEDAKGCRRSKAALTHPYVESCPFSSTIVSSV